MHRPIKRIALALALAAFPTPALATSHNVKIVTIDDTPWRVIVKADGATVQPRRMTLYRRIDPKFFADAKRAAEEATGCKAGDTTNWRMTAYVSLDCSANVAAN